MARFSVGGDEDGNEEGANGDRRLPKRPRTSGPIVYTLKSSNASTSTPPGGRAFAPNPTNPASSSAVPQPPSRLDAPVSVEELEESEEESDTSFSDTSSSSSSEGEDSEDEFVIGEQVVVAGEDVQPAEAGMNSVPNVNGMVREPVETVGDAPAPVSVTLADPEVLDCPICLEPLSSPIYQCENGHIACASCCIKMRNKCANCCWPIGYNRCRAIEKVLESVRITCRNMQHGCTESLCYGKKLEHERTCKYAPCSCPYLGCAYTGLAKTVFAHFAISHQRIVKLFRFNYAVPVLLVSNQKHVFLQDRHNDTLFVLNRSIEPFGSSVNVVCIAPSSSEQRFVYDLTARDGVSSLQLKTVAECTPKWVPQTPAKKFLIVPKDFGSSDGELRFQLTIWRDVDFQ